MSQTDEQLGFLDSRSLAVRGGLIAAVIITVLAMYYGARWQMGQAFAESFAPNTENAAQVSALAVSIAPQNSLAYSNAAKVQQGRSLPDILANAQKNNENAVRYSPNDYRYWLDLGRTREQSGDRAAGEVAMRRSVELAPAYAYPRWMLGNLLLRAGRRDEALAEFKQTAATHSTLRQQVFYLVWESSNGDAEQLKQLFGDTPVVRAALAVFYAQKNLPNESVQMWQSLTTEEKGENANAAENAMLVNYQKFNFHAAAVFTRDLGVENVEIDKITNGGFESDIPTSKNNIFNWFIPQTKGVDVSIDLRQPAEGKRSLRMTFNGYAEPTLLAAGQAVAVEPNTRYKLTFALRTSDLRSAGTPLVEVVEVKTAKGLGATAPFAAGTISEWQAVSLEFATPPDTQAVVVRTVRAFCGENCPIVGIVWYDDFKLEKLGKTDKK